MQGFAPAAVAAGFRRLCRNAADLWPRTRPEIRLRSLRPAWIALACAALLAAGCDAPAPDHEAHDDHGAHDDHDQHADENDEHEEHEDGVVRLGPEAMERIGLETAPVETRALEGRLTATGTVGFDEERLAQVGSRTAGRLVEIPAELGARVGEGDVLAVVDSTELGEAKADYLRASAHYEVKRQELERQTSLYADHVTSRAELIRAEGQAKEAAADLAATREKLLLLGLDEAEVDALHWNDPEASRTAIRAPFAGRVVERDATLGELVQPTDTLFLLADLSRVWMWIDLYERDLSRVRLGQAVEVRLDAWPGETFGGEVAYLGDRLDPETRTLRGRVDLENPEGRLRPGMFGRALLRTGDARRVPAVPREAIQRPVQREGDAAFVFVRRSPGVFERRPVRLGQVTERWAEVLDGVAPGEEVVTNGAFLLKSQASADQLGGHHH